MFCKKQGQRLLVWSKIKLKKSTMMLIMRFYPLYKKVDDPFKGLLEKKDQGYSIPKQANYNCRNAKQVIIVCIIKVFTAAKT